VYWDLTPVQYFALRERYLETVELADFRAGLLDARIRSIMGVKNAHPYDEFPHWKKKLEPQLKKQRVRKLKEGFRAMAALTSKRRKKK
jgi:hypothetical protein